MKKIFRMALVFALAGATLLYTGCTKDYNEDINNLAGQINDLKSTHATDIANLNSALNNLESSLKSADAAIEAAYKKADDALAQSLKDAEGKIAANEDAINGLKGDVKDLQDAVEANADDIKALNDDITKVAEDVAKDLAALETKLTGAFQAADADLQKQIDDNLADAKNSLDEAKKLLLNELRSIVFVPELYYAGIEAAEYTWTSYYRQDMQKLEKDYDFTYAKTQFVLGKGTEVYAVNAADKDGIVLDPVALSQLATAQYELNPSSFDVNKASKWELNGTDYRFVVRGEEEEEPVWAPIFKDITSEAGVATVKYMIENPWLLPVSVYEDAEDIDYPEFVMDEINAVVEDNDLEEIMQVPGLFDFFKKSIDWIINQITSTPGQSGNKKLDEAKLAKYLKDLNAEVEKIGNQVEALGRKENRDIAAVKADIMRLYTALGQQNLQIARLYVLANQNYEGTGYVPVMNLTATLEGDRKIASDYEAIVSNTERFIALAFDSAFDYQTAHKGCSKGEHLYTSVYGAIGNKASVVASYDKPLDLDFIKIHMANNTAKGEQVKSLAQLQEVYPKLRMTYELVDYKAGKNQTSEAAYGKIENGKFYAMTVDEKGNQIAPSADNNYGIAAVGKCPVVLVKLFNGDDLVMAGYYKIEIVKEKSTSVIALPDFGTLPFICSYDALTTDWSVFSAKIIDGLGETYKSFKANYNIVNTYGREMPLNINNSHKAAVYVIDENPKSETYGEYVMTDKFGTITYSIDANGAVVNDSFAWQLPANAKVKPGTYTVYVKFTDGEYKVIYVAFTVSIAEPASFNFGANKIANEWYTDINDETANTVKVNVYVPIQSADQFNYTSMTGRVMQYDRNLDHYFVNYKPSRVLAEGVDPVYNKLATDGKTLLYADDLETSYTYKFAVDQPKVGKYQLAIDITKNDKGEIVSADYNTLYATWFDKPTDKTPQVEVLATLNGSVLTYATNDVAKEILNLYKFDATDPAEKVYANIHVDVTYGDCKIPAGEEDFHARFQRPLAIDWADAQEIEESGVGGDNIEIIKYLNGIIDWNNQKVIVANTGADKAKYPYIENEIAVNGGDKVNMYKYYGFQKLYVDLGNATRDNFDADATKTAKVSYVTPKAKLTVVGKDTPDNGVVELDIKNFKSLYDYVINYQNDEATVESFNLFIPVTVEYAWGKITDGVLTVKVKKTGNVK